MICLDFNENWRFRRVGEEAWHSVQLPHDALLFEKRVKDAESGVHLGWYLCHDYEYEKSFTLPMAYLNKHLTLEFEGIYHNAEVYVNGKKVAFRPYGYTNFYLPLDTHLKIGEENVVKVIARNADQPNSRWYSGAGIYRPVRLWVTEKEHVLLNGLKIRTLQISPAVIEISVATSCEGEVQIEIEKDGTMVASNNQFTNGIARFTLEIPNAELWSPERPALYTCKVKFYQDEHIQSFGIRTISYSAKTGFCLNGKRTILRGACIHHDNGILGARCYKEAEERKIALLKSYGYNAVRSAHNPCSKYLLDACDKLGVMVVDEYVDMWYVHKTKHDYADYIFDWHEQDIQDMIDKDYNHPSVIMYSLGNEVAETGQKQGIAFFKKMRDLCHTLDEQRPVTVGVNIFFNWLHAMGFGVYNDKKAESNAQAKVGSEFFNTLAGLTGAKFMKFMATLYPCDVKTRTCYAEMDVAGYNYGIMRYKKDLKKYPQRIILGSETFCSDAYAFFELAKTHPALIGDFVWSGIDYLGEVGIGSWEYKNYAPNFINGVGWISAGSGRLDLIGNPLGEALYTKVAFELEDKPQIAVVPVNHTHAPHSPSAWKFSNALPSWSWNGLRGKPAKVEVYSRAPIVELYVNGKKVGRKKFGKNCRFVFHTNYYDGEITAINLDKDGKELARNTLTTAGEKTILHITPEKEEVQLGEICFIQLAYTDENGIVKPLERGKIDVRIEGGELLGLGHACPFNADGFTNSHTDTYFGRALAVAKITASEMKITAMGNGHISTCTLFAGKYSKTESIQ